MRIVITIALAFIIGSLGVSGSLITMDVSNDGIFHHQGMYTSGTGTVRESTVGFDSIQISHSIDTDFLNTIYTATGDLMFIDKSFRETIESVSFDASNLAGCVFGEPKPPKENEIDIRGMISGTVSDSSIDERFDFSSTGTGVMSSRVVYDNATDTLRSVGRMNVTYSVRRV